MRTNYRKLELTRKWAAIFALLIGFVLTPINSRADSWLSVGSSRDMNISGMALVDDTAERTVFLVVHDNKKKNEKRAGLIVIDDSRTPLYTALEWAGDKPPVDLEAITAIADKPYNFLALASSGKIFHLELEKPRNVVRVIRSFDVPTIPVNSDFEGLAFQKIGPAGVIAWADRGEDVKPGTLFWSKFDLGTYTFGEIGSALIKVPFPGSNVRHISDVKIDAQGKIFISSAADPGNDGPFASAVYLAGSLGLENSQLVWSRAAELPPVFSISNRKIEAFEILPGGNETLAFGTDDENLGSAVYFNRSGSFFAFGLNPFAPH